ncbi:TIGR04104 family putative zinc finger protein [Bacillus sp. FJAT-44742]|uniref:TIGR04104 family putative zinc finger protein n=1 Tax=Bacillus sp. FJAT-44742 TaxID=2014005 RepID=UPI000C23DFAC
MPTCQHCYTKWAWKETLKGNFSLHTALICPYCNAKQYPTAKTKKLSFVMSLFTLSPMVLNMVFSLGYITILLMFLIGVSMILISPFLTKVSNMEESII